METQMFILKYVHIGGHIGFNREKTWNLILIHGTHYSIQLIQKKLSFKNAKRWTMSVQRMFGVAYLKPLKQQN